MNILAINTCFTKTYVSLCVGDKKIYKTMDSALKQSENVLGIIDECLSEANLSISNLNAISCVIGPGSFTGIRIGASLAKGFCFACSKIKRIAINSLDLVAFSFSKNAKSDFWVVLNALSGNLFACRYDKSGKRILEPMLIGGENISEISGAVVGLKEENLDLCTNYLDLNCEDLLEYSQSEFSSNNFTVDYVPLYLRKSQAEAEMDKKNGNN